MTVIGWCDCFLAPYKEVKFTKQHKKALIECIRHRRYDYTHDDLCNLPYSAPVFDDYTTVVPSKSEWDEVLREAYNNTPRTHRLIPLDAIKDSPLNDILFENKKFKEQYGRRK